MSDSNPIEKALQKHALATKGVRKEFLQKQTEHRKGFGAPLWSPAVRSAPVSSDDLAYHRIFTDSSLGSDKGQLSLLGSQVLQEMERNDWRVLGITSPTRRCGKSTLAANLAIGIAKRVRENIVLVDSDISRPGISEYFGIDAENGLAEYLSGEAALETTLVDPGIPRLLLAPNAGSTDRRTGLPATAEIVAFVKRLKTASDVKVAVLDLPPLLKNDDALTLLPYLDCVLMVIADGSTTKRQLKESQRLIKGVNALGFVLNRAEGS